MKKPIIITAFNDNPIYRTFVRSCIKMWTNFGYDIKLGYISGDHDEEFISDVSSELNENSEIIRFGLVDGVNSGVQSKITRMIMASEEESFWIIDVDLFVLNIKWYEDKLDQLNGYNILCNEKHDNDPNAKWPMSSNIGSGKLLKDVINPDGLKYYELIESWKTLPNVYDSMENITNDFTKFSDESLLRRFVADSGLKEHFIFYKRNEPNLFNHHINSASYYHDVMKRIDRAWAWSYNKERLYSGYYIDCQPKRPLDEKDYIIKDIFNYLKI